MVVINDNIYRGYVKKISCQFACWCLSSLWSSFPSQLVWLLSVYMHVLSQSSFSNQLIEIVHIHEHNVDIEQAHFIVKSADGA